jgi:septal ring factor EnvC (AmiA/AmiB activator)
MGTSISDSTRELSATDLSRLFAQRNAAIATAAFLTCVLFCGAWTLEAIPKRFTSAINVDEQKIAQLQTEIGKLQNGLIMAQQSLSTTEKALRNTQAALLQTENALNHPGGK